MTVFSIESQDSRHGAGPSRREFLTRSGMALGGLALGMHAAGPAWAEVDPAIYAAAEGRGFPKPKFVETNGIRMAVYEEGVGFPVIFSHGFPELAYSWRHQLPALAKAGFRAIAPDQRGYGRTSRPSKIEDYDIHHLCGDLIGMMDAFELEKAVFCGHDWGGFVVWQMAHLHPDRVAGVIGVNTPYAPRTPMSIVDLLKATLGEDNYIVYFQEVGPADDLLGNNVEKAFRSFFADTGLRAEEFNKLPADAPERKFDIRQIIEVDPSAGLLISEEELAYYIATFQDTGFTGGINWYRNLDRNWKTTEGQKSTIEAPCLYVGAEDDLILPPSRMLGAERWLPDLEQKVIADCGHWTQQEKPEELNAILVDWLTRKFKA